MSRSSRPIVAEVGVGQNWRDIKVARMRICLGLRVFGVVSWATEKNGCLYPLG